MPEWTEQQKTVIEADGRRLICSAAAGSGKTAVMVERIVRMLREGSDPESFLVVTFTNAAAAEMKEKIRKRIREEKEDRALRTVFEKMDIMEICTIHSFCQHLIRQEFQAAGVDPFFRICDGGMRRRLFSKSFRDACNRLLQEKDEDFAEFRRRFDKDRTEETVGQVYEFMMSLPDPYGWLGRACDDVPDRIDPDHPWFRVASQIVRELIQRAQAVLRNQYAMFDEPEHIEAFRSVWIADRELFHVKQCWLEGEEVSAEALSDDFCRMPQARGLNSLEIDWKERYNTLRNDLKEIGAQIGELIFPDPEKTAADFGNIRESLRGLRKIVTRTAEQFAERKAKMRVLDFGDLEHKALEILSRPELRESVRKRYVNVFVDECQDVSAVQDAVIQALGGAESRLFMVGDVKQSIYRFRRADPTLFLNRKNAYKEAGSEGACLDLQTNFRSRPEILETANTVFRDVMRRNTAELDYSPQDELIPGKHPDGYVPVMVDLLEPDDQTPRIAALAGYVAEEAKKLVEEGQFSYRDMIILMPKVSGEGKQLSDELEKRGVPVFFDGGGDFFELPEVKTFRLLLELIENDDQDLPLISTLKNAPFFFPEEELAQVRLADPGKDVPFYRAFRKCAKADTPVGKRCREAQERIRIWQELAEVTPLDALLFHLAGDSLQYAMAGASSSGKTAQQNLRVFCAQGTQAEAAGIHTLREFLAFVSDQAVGGDTRSAAPLAEGDNVIRIMTMHKSKGLQFPVVFCLGLDREIRGRRDGGVLMDAELGIALRCKLPGKRISRRTAADRIFEWKKEREELAERIRLLYVAMTRAQERMFLAGVTEMRPGWRVPAGNHRVLSAADYLDLILPALLDSEKESTGCAQTRKPWKIRILSGNQQKNVENRKVFHSVEKWLDSLLSGSPVDDLWIDLNEENVPVRMSKKSVSAIIRNAENEILGEEQQEETPEEKRVPDRFSAALRRYDTGRYPAFMMPPPEKRGAWRGTIMHRFLSLADLEKVRTAGANLPDVLREMRDGMRACGVFTQEETEAVSVPDAARFFESGIGTRMLQSPEVRREWGFNLVRDDGRLLVQGVMDCAFLEDGEWILLDYKTDRMEDEAAFAETYRPQLAWYAEALERLTGKRVKEKWLYALSAGKAVRV